VERGGAFPALLVAALVALVSAAVVLCDPGCAALKWGALILTVEDWAGRPLRNMLVTAYLRYVKVGSELVPVSLAAAQAMNFTSSDGTVLLYVPTRVAYYAPHVGWVEGVPLYEVKVFWLDTPLLCERGVIGKPITVYSSEDDPVWGERYYMPGEGSTLKTFVYTLTLRLAGSDGDGLPPEIFNHIRVEVTWPDGSVTVHTLENGALQSDGTVLLVMNEKTLVYRPGDLVSLNPGSEVPQAPPGPYTVKVFLGDLLIAYSTISVEKSRVNVPLQLGLRTVKVPVARDAVITLHTPFNTPMGGCEVRVEGLATELVGSSGTYVTDSTGRITVPYILLGYYRDGKFASVEVEVEVREWRGMPIEYRARVAAKQSMGVIVPNIGRLIVKVVGARGQGIPGALVKLTGPANLTGSTGKGGTWVVEVVEGTWNVTAEKGGKTATKTVSVTGGEESEAKLRLDIFLSALGLDLSLGEFVLSIAVAAALVIVTYALASEYRTWRMRRVVRVLKKAEERPS